MCMYQSLSLSTYIYIYMCMCMYIYIYIYIYTHVYVYDNNNNNDNISFNAINRAIMGGGPSPAGPSRGITCLKLLVYGQLSN